MLLISRDFHLSSWEHELVVSGTIALAAVGSLFSGILNRLYGRRPVLLAGSVVFTLGALLMAVARTVAELVLGRMVVGVGVGLASSTVPMFIAELAPPERRGELVSLNSACIVLGQVIATLVDGAFSGVPQGWRYMFGLGGVPSLVQFFGLILLPESPRWLLSMGREQQARHVMRRLLPPTPELEEKVEAQVHEMLESLKVERFSFTGDATGGIAQLPVRSGHISRDNLSRGSGSLDTTVTGRWRKNCAVTLAKLWRVRRQLELGVGLQLLQQLIGINTIMYYSGSILKQSFYGHLEPTDEQRQLLIWLTAPVAAAQLLGCIGATDTRRRRRCQPALPSPPGSGARASGALIAGGLWLVDQAGRRSMVLFSLAGVAVTLAVEGAAFAIDEWHCAAETTQSEGVCSVIGWISLLAMAAYLVVFGFGMAPVPWLVNAEIFPLDVRSTCVGIATAVNWIANLIVAASFLSLEEAISRPVAFWLYGSFAVVGGVYLRVRMPETAGRSLEEIEQLFHAPRRVWLNTAREDYDVALLQDARHNGVGPG